MPSRPMPPLIRNEQICNSRKASERGKGEEEWRGLDRDISYIYTITRTKIVLLQTIRARLVAIRLRCFSGFIFIPNIIVLCHIWTIISMVSVVIGCIIWRFFRTKFDERALALLNRKSNEV